jgi:hypothetical protein
MHRGQNRFHLKCFTQTPKGGIATLVGAFVKHRAFLREKALRESFLSRSVACTNARRRPKSIGVFLDSGQTKNGGKRITSKTNVVSLAS